MRVAYVHDWLVTYRGGEKVLEALLSLYPDAPIYTLFYDPAAMPESIRSRRVIYPPLLNRLRKLRKGLLPLLPAAVESLRLEGYDLIISTSSCVAKGVIPDPGAKHLCYLHSPMRYIWDQRQEYLGPRGPARWLIVFLSSFLRLWDTASSARVDRFVVNSRFVGQRAAKYYGRSSVVVAPPIEVERFGAWGLAKRATPYVLAAGAFVGYKRFDLAIAACKLAGKNLIIAGSGPDEKTLRRLAGSHVTFEIAPTQERWVELMQGAEAFLFPGVEDFGMTAIEAMAAGTPVIAYQAGGALDFIEPGVTGAFFAEPTASSLAAALRDFEAKRFDPVRLRAYADNYRRAAFLAKMRAEIASLVTGGTA